MTRVFVLSALVCTGLLAAWYVIVFHPVQAREQSVSRQIEASRDTLQDFRETVAEIPSAMQTSQELLASREDLSSSLYAKSDIVRLFDDIGEDISRHNLTLTAITPPVEELLALNEKALNPAEPLFLNVTLTIKGDFISFGKYVWTLERASFFRGVNRCTIRNGATRNQDVTFDLGIRALLGGEGDKT